MRCTDAPPVTEVPATANVDVLCPRSRSLNPGESQHTGSDNQNLPQDRTVKVPVSSVTVTVLFV